MRVAEIHEAGPLDAGRTQNHQSATTKRKTLAGLEKIVKPKEEPNGETVGNAVGGEPGDAPEKRRRRRRKDPDGSPSA